MRVAAAIVFCVFKVGHPEMPPSCLELNSDDFPFFKIPPSTSRTRDSRGGIFTIKIPTFSGKTAEKVMSWE